MKKKSILLFVSVIFFAACSNDFDYEVKPIDQSTHYDNVYVIMGQSNATGVAKASFLETKSPSIYAKYSAGNPKVLIACDVDTHITKTFKPVRFGFGADDGYFGPEIGMSEMIESEDPAYIIKGTWSGSCLQTQYMDYSGTKLELYNRYTSFILERLGALKDEGKNPRLRGIFWMQGESDSLNQICNTYKDAESLFIKHLRKDLNEYVYGYVNFVDAYISTKSIFWENPTVINQHKDQVAELDEHNYCIHTNGEDENAIDLTLKSLSGEDNDAAHYDSLSMLSLGLEAGKFVIK